MNILGSLAIVLSYYYVESGHLIAGVLCSIRPLAGRMSAGSRFERVNPICSHDNFDVTTTQSVKPVKLVEKFQHHSLNFTFSTGT